MKWVIHAVVTAIGLWLNSFRERFLITIIFKGKNMQRKKIEFTQLAVVIALTFCTVGVYAQKSQGPAQMNIDQVDGRAGEAEGKAKEATGVILDDRNLQTEGNVQKNAGKAQKSYGDLKQDIEQGK
ncbi:MAG: CsbD family protein [Nitrosomonas sp.]|nr:CsbD family protein [Nitrosomonas sp.]